MNKSGGDSDCVFIFTDESYVNINHASASAFMPKDVKKGGKLKRKTGKGKRLIIFHAIGEDGPLVENDLATGYPIDELVWTGDTPHP